MINIQQACLIVLTYKRKILLKRQEELISVNKNTWSFIEKENADESAILKEVEKEMNITIPYATFLISCFDSIIKRNFYHAGLTDGNVNQIQRQDGQELNFFSLKEVELLKLSESSKLLFKKYKNMIEEKFEN